jgi:hypothetical protein
MSTVSITRNMFDRYDESDYMICVFCDNSTQMPYCSQCQEYKGLMTVDEWEAYTGETWEY